MSAALKLTRNLAVRLPGNYRPRNRRSQANIQGRPRVLIVGVYLAHKPNHTAHLVNELGSAKLVDVEQRWACMMGQPPDKEVAAVTSFQLNRFVAKWQLVNELISDPEKDVFDYVIVCDDDILIGKNFVDRFIAEQQSLDFALSQPARTWRSFTDHPIVRRRLFTRARQTNFVEIGPLVSFRRDFFSAVFPFSLESPMGWGYDLTWPLIARDLNLTMGIIDGTPIDHSLRARSSLYSMSEAMDAMTSYLSTRAHIANAAAARTIRTFR
jgi:hypothetical protein